MDAMRFWDYNIKIWREEDGEKRGTNRIKRK